MVLKIYIKRLHDFLSDADHITLSTLTGLCTLQAKVIIMFIIIII